MDPIEQEIEAMAEKLEKSSKTQAFTVDLVKATLRQLGPEGLKKAAANLSDDQKGLLKSILEDMAKTAALTKSHKEPVKDAGQTLEPVINSTETGDYKENEKKPKQLEADEKIADAAKARGQENINHQGDRPESLPGQVIKSETPEENIAKGGSGSGRQPVNPALSGLESVKELADRKKDEAEIQSKFAEAPKPEGAKPKSKGKEPVKPTKELVKGAIAEMQKRNLEKSVCVAKLAKSLNVDEAKLGAVWDHLAKGDTLPEKGNPEGTQSSVPDQMKDKKKVEARTPESGASKNTADEGEQPPAPMKKSDSFFHVEEEMYLAKSENPFAVRSTGQNVSYKVDEYIDLSSASETQRLAKSKFDYLSDDYRADEDVLVKGMEPDPTQQVVESNAKQQAEAKQDDAEEIRNIKINEKLSRIEGQGQKMPMLKGKLAKSKAEALLEKGLDMDQGTFETAVANRAAQASGAFLIKSFDDSDMDLAFNTQDMWADGNKFDASGTLEKAGSGPGSRGGKVIGHTKSGKPIYDSHDHAEHAAFAPDDHQDARNAHDNEAFNHFDRDNAKMEHHFNEAEKHRVSANPGSNTSKKPQIGDGAKTPGRKPQAKPQQEKPERSMSSKLAEDAQNQHDAYFRGKKTKPRNFS